MGNTIYASFTDPAYAERAAGALLDFGVKGEDISIVQSHSGYSDPTNYNYGTGTSTGIVDAPSDTIGSEPSGWHPDVPATSTGIVDAPSDTIGSEPRVWHPDVQATSTGAERSGFATPVSAIWDPAASDITRDLPIDEAGDTESQAKHGISTTSAADAEAGAVKGAAWGAGVGILAAVAALMVPGFGLIAGGGALAIALGGFAASAGAGAIAGAVTGYLKDQGVDVLVAQEYEGTLTGGGALLAVTVPSGAVTEADARIILEKYRAVNINAYSSRGYLS